MIWLAVGATMLPPEGKVPVVRLGVSMVMSIITCGSSAGAKHMKDTTMSPLGLLAVRVPVLSAVPVLPPTR